LIIFIPTYKRTKILPFVLKSVLNSNYSNINERILVLINNKYFQDRKKIKHIVSSCKFNSLINCKIVNEIQKGANVFDWYELIFKFAKKNECVTILGDDDLLMPYGIENRYKEINRLKGDLIISRHLSRLVFFKNGQFCWPNFLKKQIHKNLKCDHNFNLENFWDGSFISNHFFRNTAHFKKGLNLVRKWCETQTYAQFFASGLAPLYLSYAIKIVGGKVLSLQEYSVIRGQIFEESLSKIYSDGGSVMLYNVLALNTFSNKDFFKKQKLVAHEKKILLKSIKFGLYELINIKNNLYQQIKTCVKLTKLNWILIIFSSGLFNFRLLLRSIFPFLQGVSFRMVQYIPGQLVETSKFLKNIKKEYCSNV
jgi:hypothetical protein